MREGWKEKIELVEFDQMEEEYAMVVVDNLTARIDFELALELREENIGQSTEAELRLIFDLTERNSEEH